MKKTMTLMLALCALCSQVSTTIAAEAAPVQTEATLNGFELNVNIHPSEGFMEGGWGVFNFNFGNPEDKSVTVKEVRGDWKINGKSYHKWSQDVNMDMKGKPTGHHGVITPMLGNAKKLIEENGANPIVECTAVLTNGEEVTCTIEVPVAELTSPIHPEQGKYMRVEAQDTSWANVKSHKKVMFYLDKAYAHMQKLTGNTPFEGKISVIKECPRNPYFGYAGNPIVLNTEYVPAALEDFDNDRANYGWIHEMGHNFDDVVGGWYNEGAIIEFQANLKLSYVIEKMCTKDSKYKIISWKDHKTPVTGVQFNDEIFTSLAQPYIESGKAFADMSTDEYHALFMTVIRKYGWGPIKKLYATYQKLLASGQTPPQGADKNLLFVAVLDYATGMKLEKMYKEWRIPMGGGITKEWMKQYGIIK